MKKIIVALLLISTPVYAAPKKQSIDLSAQVKKGPIGTAIENAIEGKKEAVVTSTKQDIFKALSKPFKDIADFIGQDDEDAIALATATDIKDGHGQQCWIAFRNFNAIAKVHPLPLTGGGMRDLEALRLLNISAKDLCSNPHCTQVFTDLRQAAITIAQGVAGQLGAMAIRNVPSLTDLCTMVPNVPLADPIDPVPPPPSIGNQAPKQ